MRTMLPTGSRGFTLIEILLTLSIFTLGFSRLFLVFFESGAALRHVGNRLSAVVFMENAVWEAGRGRGSGSLQEVHRYNKTEPIGRQNIQISVLEQKVPGFSKLYKLEAEASWKEGKRSVSLRKEGLIRRL